MQFDEKWSFVAQKEKNCGPDEPQRGDCWDHVALDAESRLVLSVIPGKRTAPNTVALVQDVRKRLGDKLPSLITSDEYAAYRDAILRAFGTTVTPEPTGKPGRPKAPYQVPPAELNYATVHKTREKGRVVAIDHRVVFGTPESVGGALASSTASRHINTAFVERQNGTDRNRNARKVRETYCFSKDWGMHAATTYFTMYSYNFCWPVRTLAVRDPAGRLRRTTPAMAAGLTEHVWTLLEWLRRPVVQRE